MIRFDPAVVKRLREMALRSDSVSQMLRAIVSQLAPESAATIVLIKHMREAFGLSLKQAKPIAGWAADGTGHLQDSQVDRLIMPAIWKNWLTWDSSPSGEGPCTGNAEAHQ
jgi:hypothetical protein